MMLVLGAQVDPDIKAVIAGADWNLSHRCPPSKVLPQVHAASIS